MNDLINDTRNSYTFKDEARLGADTAEAKRRIVTVDILGPGCLLPTFIRRRHSWVNDVVSSHLFSQVSAPRGKIRRYHRP